MPKANIVSCTFRLNAALVARIKALVKKRQSAGNELANLSDVVREALAAGLVELEGRK